MSTVNIPVINIRHKLRIFISYSHSNLAQMNLLKLALEEVDELGEKSFQVRYDTGEEKLAENTHREISKNINWADIIIPIVTNEWLQSHECRDELVRAHERRKRIIPFREDCVREDGSNKIPFFLHEQLFVTWSQRDIPNAIGELIRKLETLSYERWKHEYFRLVRKAGDLVADANEVPRWKSNLICNRIFSQAVDKIQKVINSTECSFDIAQESNYLHFAEPVFAHSKSIIAICIARISTFWSNSDFRYAASNYLGRQKVSADSIVRLFVFDSADEVNSYKNILQAHFIHYGNKNNCGVFFCSLIAYKKLVERWLNEVQIGQESFNEDFALLTFDDADFAMEATLTKNQFRYREYKPDEPLETKNLVIKEHFSRLLTIPPGDIDAEFEIARWHDSMLSDSSTLANRLESLFGKRGGKIRHYVCIKTGEDSQSVERCLYNLLYSLSSKKETLKILDITVDRRIGLQIYDGRFGGVLNTADDFDFILKIEFSNEEALRHFYNHELHSIERESLYCALLPSVSPSYAELKTMPGKERSAFFQKIEDALTSKQYIRRYDVRDEEPFDSIVRKPGIDFKIANK